jgi:hypothetical protein
MDVSKGTYTELENKISVTTEKGEHSVLFEDIASVSYETKTEQKRVGIGCLVTIVAFSFAYAYSESFWIGLSSIFLLAIIPKSVDYDIVTIETKGGKEISYRREKGQGKLDMNNIEQSRRQMNNQ